jgi:hypothetical protein
MTECSGLRGEEGLNKEKTKEKNKQPKRTKNS